MQLDVVATPEGPAAHRPDRSFNLFRRVDAPELRCAVPQDRAVPPFIKGEDWEFAGTLGAEETVPRGFDPGQAGTFARWNGFYLFETWTRDRPAR